MEAVSGMADRLTQIRQLVERWRGNPAATFQSWFLWDERIQNFRLISRRVQLVATETKVGIFLPGHRSYTGFRTTF